jgi:hypothetical protein
MVTDTLKGNMNILQLLVLTDDRRELVFTVSDAQKFEPVGNVMRDIKLFKINIRPIL